jgi:hypothetical protein
MCFTIDPLNREAKIAERNINCWKRVYIRRTGDCTSSVCGFLYTQDVLPSRVNIQVLNNRFVEDGYHSFTTRRKALKRGWGDGGDIVRFVIPKGTRYFVDKAGQEYVCIRNNTVTEGN